MESLTTAQFVTAWVIDTAVAIAVFLHADRRGNRNATWWGIGVFLCLIVFLPAYVWRARSTRTRA